MEIWIALGVVAFVLLALGSRLHHKVPHSWAR